MTLLAEGLNVCQSFVFSMVENCVPSEIHVTRTVLIVWRGLDVIFLCIFYHTIFVYNLLQVVRVYTEKRLNVFYS